MPRSRLLVAAAVAWFVLARLALAAEPKTEDPPAALASRGILIDGIHAHDLSTVALEPGVYEYHATVGYRRQFDYLRWRGIRCDRAIDGRLDAERLAGHRLLFINLPSAERPPFLVSEIAAIRQFVASGGSLFVVTDHTNAYFHAHVLQPLFTELDLGTNTSTACDVPPNTLGSGNGWIAVTRFKPHPVTAGLRCLALQTGGCVDARFAVALTGEKSWADAWRTGPYGAENAPGFYGNFQRDPGEPSGPLGVVLAKQFGRGRIVVAGDQNMLGASFVNYADNYRLWLNAMAWLLDDESLARPEPYRQWRSPRLVCYEDFHQAAWGASDTSGCYHAWVLLNRFYWAFAGDEISPPCDLVLFAYNECNLPASVVSETVAHLRRGKSVLVLNAVGELLWDEPGAVGQIVKAMGASRPKTRTDKGTLVIELPQAGRIHVLGPDKLLDNGVLPPPTRPPTEPESARIGGFLDAVREALATGPRP
jgi:hypothetical protein